ncbi:MAG: hypothetical protein D3903_00405 [Candidatus Electrothrix sp. GM3_4]|nr:hypothetical protein [Candidatus Electrothrix sp. GM3_4]
MTPIELERILKDMYENAPKGESTTMIRLFGIKYANELNECGVSMTVIAKNSVGSSYQTEIRKGINLAKYVQLKDSHYS